MLEITDFKTRKKYTNMTRAWNLEDAYISPGEILKTKESTTRTDWIFSWPALAAVRSSDSASSQQDKEALASGKFGIETRKLQSEVHVV
jgi:hypothetical protein